MDGSFYAYLVDSGRDLGCGEDLLEGLLREVRHADSLYLAFPNQRLHAFPGVGHLPVGVDVPRAICLQGDDRGTIRDEADGPVDEVQIEVVGAELGQRQVQRLLDAVVVRAPELAGDEHLGAGDARGLDAAADLVLVAVHPRAVDVPVAGLLDGVLDGVGDFVRLGLPGA